MVRAGSRGGRASLNLAGRRTDGAAVADILHLRLVVFDEQQERITQWIG
jgi:hypothetical protein